MRRLARIVLNAVTSASLVLCATTAVLWARSYFASDAVTRQRPASAVTVALARGRASVTVERIQPRLGRPSSNFPRSGWWLDLGRPPVDYLAAPHWHRRTRAGFGHVPLTAGGSMQVIDCFVLPLWAILLVSAAVPALRHAAYCRHRRRLRHGRCPCCGYDLRATPDRCPECGTIPAQ